MLKALITISLTMILAAVAFIALASRSNTPQANQTQEAYTAATDAQDAAEINPSLLTPNAPECNQTAPETFDVHFDTDAGPFIVRVNRAWAPLGADRFYNLVVNGFYDNCTFFRVVPNFVVQFGLTGSPQVNASWQNARIQDDKVMRSNTTGRLCFATSGPNSRTTQLFVNTADNAGLDSQGFAPFGEVINGMNNVKRIFAGYGQRPNQQAITMQGDAYLQTQFPKLTRIKKAKILEAPENDAP